MSRGMIRRVAVGVAGVMMGGALAVPATLLTTGAAHAATAPDAAFSCTYSGFEFDYTGDVGVTAAWNTTTSKVDLVATFESMTNPAPKAFVNYPGSSMTTTAAVTVAGAPASLTGTAGMDFVGGTPMTMPPVKGSVSSAASSLAVGVTKVTSVVTYDGSKTASFVCTPKSAVTITVPVTGRPAATPAPGVSAACKAAQAKVKSLGAKVAALSKSVKKLKAKHAKKAKLTKAKRKVTAAKKQLSAARVAAAKAC